MACTYTMHYFLTKMYKFVLIFAFAVAVSARTQGPFLSASGKYYVSEEELEYAQAYATCKRYNLSLVTEKSAEDTLNINAALNDAGATSSDHFIGGFRQQDGLFNPSWIWMDSGETFNYTRWYNNVESVTYNCLVKKSITNYAGNWTSGSCTTALYFICEAN